MENVAALVHLTNAQLESHTSERCQTRSRGLAKLTKLELDECVALTAEGVTDVANIRSLANLNLMRTNATDEHIGCLSTPTQPGRLERCVLCPHVTLKSV